MNLSIIIPTYNVEKYITDTLFSLINQTEDNFELIIVDDSSTDKTINKVKEIISKSKINNCKIIEKEKNEGVSSARNAGIIRASGKYVMFLDGDDYISNNLVAIINQTIEEMEVEVICWGFNVVKEENKSHINYFEKYSSNITNMTGYEALQNIIINNLLWICTGNVAIKRNLLINTNIKYSENCVNGEDQEFTIKVLSVADSVYFINDILLYYVQRDGSISNTYNINRFDAINAMIRSYKYLQGKSDARGKKIIQVIKNERILENYFYNFKSCLAYLIKNENFSNAFKILNMDMEKKYPGLREMIMYKMKNYNGNNKKIFFQVKVFLFSPFIFFLINQWRDKIKGNFS